FAIDYPLDMNLAAFIFGTATVLMHHYMENDRQEDLSKTLTEIREDIGFPRPQYYDFIIVGAGAAGCMLAGKLAQHHTVLLLEKGGSAPPSARNLFLQRFVARDPTTNDFFFSVPQTHMSLTNSGIHRMVVGKMMGGSQSHNNFKYSRGSPHDYNYYANVTNDESWNWQNIKRHFLALENFDAKQQFVDEANRAHMGTDGPILLDSSYLTNAPGLIDAWFEAGRALNYSITDPNGENQIGFTPLHRTIRNGERQSAYVALVEPMEKAGHPNLKVQKYSHVDEIIINPVTLVAEGVRYKKHGFAQIAMANKEVIVSAGTHSSPMLLIRSGIGPRATLEEAQIRVLSDLPVGKNLKAHVCVEPFFTVLNAPPDVFVTLNDSDYISNIEKYLQPERESAFAQANTTAGNAWLVTSVAKQRNEGDWSDLQIVMTPRIPQEEGTPVWVGVPVIINRLDSVGEIRFNVNAYRQGIWDDPDLALVDYQMYLSGPADMTKHLEGLKLAFELVEETEPFKSMNFSFRRPNLPACDTLEFRSDAYWVCYIEHETISYYHDVGTCKMGADNDPTAVLDSRLRVKGIERLRVVDASIFPQPINGNIQASVMVIASKAAEDILTEYGASSDSITITGRWLLVVAFLFMRIIHL
ncbi:Glucose dehydrogenase [FAD, quinone], partial [Pseudolycoriella hygida]